MIVVTGTKENPEFGLVADLAALIGLANSKNATPEGVAFQSELKCSAKVVAGARNHLYRRSPAPNVILLIKQLEPDGSALFRAAA